MPKARLSEILPRRCLYIDSETGPDPLCCNAKVYNHSSWCKRHYMRVFQRDSGCTEAQMDLVIQLQHRNV